MGTRLLTVVEAAERLAVRPATIRKFIYQRRLPVVKIGRSVRLRDEDLEALIRLGLQLPNRRPGR